jgi:hypothetical protein
MNISKTEMQIAFPRFMLCAVKVQIEYYNMEIIDAVDKIPPGTIQHGDDTTP